MPQNSTLFQQAADIAYTVLTNAQNGQVNAQNQKIFLEGLAAAIILLAQSQNNTLNSATLAAALTANTPTVGAVTNNVWQAPVVANPGSFIPPNFVGPTGGSDPVAFNGASGLNAGIQNTTTGAISGTPTIIATQQP